MIKEEEKDLFDSFSNFLIKKHLNIPAIFFLESIRPLKFIGAQTLLFFEPFMGAFFSTEKYNLFCEAIGKKECLDYFIEKLEA